MTETKKEPKQKPETEKEPIWKYRCGKPLLGETEISEEEYKKSKRETK